MGPKVKRFMSVFCNRRGTDDQLNKPRFLPSTSFFKNTTTKKVKSIKLVFFTKLYFPPISIIRWNEKTLHHKGPTLGAYNWTDIERYDTTDLQLLLRELEPYTKYEILLQAYNQFGRGPVAKIEAETGEKGEWLPSKDEVRLPNILT